MGIDCTDRFSVTKSPDSRVSIDIDWGEWLTEESDTQASSTWETEADGLTLDGDSTDGTVNRVFVSGGDVGRTYWLRNAIETTGGLVDSRSVRVIVRSR